MAAEVDILGVLKDLLAAERKVTDSQFDGVRAEVQRNREQASHDLGELRLDISNIRGDNRELKKGFDELAQSMSTTKVEVATRASIRKGDLAKVGVLAAVISTLTPLLHLI